MSFVMTRKEITQLAQLDGKKVGVLTETGQTSVATRITIEKAGATAVYLPLIKFERIYDALVSGEIDAGALPIDLRFSGQVRYGWNAFPMSTFDTPSIFDDHAEVDRFQPRACDERYARFRRDDPFVQDATGDCRAFVATLLGDRESESSRNCMHFTYRYFNEFRGHHFPKCSRCETFL